MADNPSGINQVGLGVYLDDGVTTLAQLRAIRQEMEAINRLSGRTPAGTGTGGSRQSQTQSWEQELNAREKAEIASQRRIANARRDAFRSIDADEVETLARAKDRRLQMTEQVNRRAAELTRKRHEEEARLEQRALDQSVRRRQAAQQRIARNRLGLVAGADDVDNISQQARLFQRYRNDPARGNLDNIFRKQIAELRLASRPFLQEARRIRREAEYEIGRTFRNESYAHIANAQRRQASAFQQVRQGYTGNVIQAQMNRDAFVYRRSQIQEASIYRQAGLPVPPSLSQQLGGYQAPARWSERGPYSGSDYGDRANAGTYSGSTRRSSAYAYPSGIFTGPRNIPPGGGPNSGNIFQSRGGGRSGSIGDSNLGIVGRITRNIILYEVVSELSYGLVNYIAGAINAAKQTVEFANALRFASEQAGANVAANQELADSFLDIGLSRQQGRSAVIEASRFAEGRPQDIASLTRVAADIASARGLGINRTDELIEQLRRRESKFYKRLFGTTVEAIYDEEAARVVGSQSVNAVDNPSLFIGLKPSEIKSRRDAISSYVQAMDDEAKENSVLNYILAQSTRFQGEAAKRADTLAGRLDKLSAAWLNGQEGLGLFISDLQVFNALLEKTTGLVSVLDGLRGPELGSGGYGALIRGSSQIAGSEGQSAVVRQRSLEYELRKQITEKTFGTRASALSLVDTLISSLPLLATVGGLGAIGRGGARTAAQNQSYYSTLRSMNAQYGPNPLNRLVALQTSDRARAGVGNSILTGASQLTSGLTNTFTRPFGYETGVRPTRITPMDQYGAARSYSPLVDPRTRNRLDNLQLGGAAGGGIAGGVIGFTVASFIANSITTNSILATGISIAGGVIGTGVGTAVGDIGAAALAGSIAGAGGFRPWAFGVNAASSAALGGASRTGLGRVAGVAGRSLIPRAGAATLGRIAAVGGLATGIAGVGSFIVDDYAERTDRKLKFETDLAVAYSDILKTQNVARRASRYRVGSDVIRADQTEQAISGIGATFGITGSTNDIAQQLSRSIFEQEGTVADLRRQIAEIPPEQKTLRQSYLEDLEKEERALSDLSDAYNKVSTNIQAGQNIRQYGSNDPRWIQTVEQYRADAAERELRRREAESREREQNTQELSQGLDKLRQARENSYQVVGEIGQALTGPDNPYTSVLAEQLTLGERMQRQWGHLGQAAVDYFTKLNTASLNRQLNRLDFGVQRQAGELREQAAREEARRFGPGLNRAETNRLDIYSAAGQALALFQNNRAQTQGLFGTRFARDIYGDQSFRPYDLAVQGLAETQALFGRGTGFGIGPGPQRAYLGGTLTSLDARSADIYGQFQLARTATRDLSSEAMVQLGGVYAEAFLGNLQGLSEQDLRRLSRAPGFRASYVDAINAQQAASNQRVQDSIKKAQLDAEESDRLTAQLRDDENFRQRQVLAGYDPRDVGRESDALFLARTDGVDPKDLSFTQFQQRQDVIKRTAERAEQDRKEATAATLLGLNYQQQMLFELEAMRTAILGGDVKMLIQVQNDTQARLDKEALELREQTASLSNYDRR